MIIAEAATIAAMVLNKLSPVSFILLEKNFWGWGWVRANPP
jgi:hypothetical protein